VSVLHRVTPILFGGSSDIMLVLPGVSGAHDLGASVPPTYGVRFSVKNGPTDRPADDDVAMVLYCRDVTNVPHSVSLDGRRTRFPSTRSQARAFVRRHLGELLPGEGRMVEGRAAEIRRQIAIRV
jgi:hypothetical protein